ncbi:MAG: S1 RNA-binding domain-containing protein, partial [Oscillospiraceae bacterium]|nr:S1 RNA-binding domain-containing protein [Oscillospiraceae bacterium]
LSWKKISHSSQVVQVGQTIEVYVKSIDRENEKISLGYKTADTDPWTTFLDQYNSFDTVEAKIVSITTFGAFAEITPDVDGLIHISQVAAEKISKVEDVLSVGQTVTALILEIDEANRRISLSIRALIQQEEEKYGGEDGPNIINLDNISSDIATDGKVEVNAVAADAFPREDFEEKVAEEEVPVTFSPQTETNPEAASATVLETPETQE